MSLQSFCHPTYILCTHGAQTLSPLTSEPGGTQTLFRLWLRARFPQFLLL